MKRYFISAIVYSLELGDYKISRVVPSDSKENAEKEFISKFMTIEILDVQLFT